MSKAEKIAAVRASLLESIARDVEQLVEQGRFTALEHTMAATGYINNSASTSAELGRAIMTLASIVPLFWLRSTAVQAAFERSFLRPNLDEQEPDQDERASRNRWERASLASIDVMREARARVMHDRRAA